MTNKSQPLTAELVGDTQLRVVRSFAAPPQQVWDAHWKPELVRRWMLGPDGWTMPICEIEPVVGAKIHLRWEDPDGNGFDMTGVVLELDEPHSSKHEEHFVDCGGAPTICETHYRDHDGGTRLELIMTYASKEDREAAMGSGMTDGMEASYARLNAMD